MSNELTREECIEIYEEWINEDLTSEEKKELRFKEEDNNLIIFHDNTVTILEIRTEEDMEDTIQDILDKMQETLENQIPYEIQEYFNWDTWREDQAGFLDPDDYMHEGYEFLDTSFNTFYVKQIY